MADAGARIRVDGIGLWDPLPVRLASSTGAVVDLRPTGYQYAEAGWARPEGAEPAAGPPDDWDANWLMIRGDASTADGRCWSFTDPCMTTWEAEELWAWLEMASQNAAGRDEVVFLEPNVSFFIDGRDGDRVRMQVRFSHESLPDWLPRDAAGWQAQEYLVALEVTTADLAAAARDWDRERRAFPAR